MRKNVLRWTDRNTDNIKILYLPTIPSDLALLISIKTAFDRQCIQNIGPNTITIIDVANIDT